MNAYEKAQQLGLTGTDQQVVDVLKTLTNSDIPVGRVAIWLRENLLWYWTSPTTMGGAFEAIVQNPSTSSDVKQGLGLFFSSVFGDGAQYLQTTVPQWAGLVARVMAGLLAIAPDKTALVDSFYALDGGKPYKDLTPTEYAGQRTAVQAAAALTTIDQAYATVQNEIVAPELSSPTRTKASIAAKLRDAAAALET